MQTGLKKLKAYESIMHNLSALKEEATVARPEEAEAIGSILHTCITQ
ncbi:hypothetical protein ACFLXA_01510 [Chloroflexota bacterium]